MLMLWERDSEEHPMTKILPRGMQGVNTAGLLVRGCSYYIDSMGRQTFSH